MGAQHYELNAVAIQQFHDMFINKLQQKEHKLANTYQLITGVVGDAYKWPTAGVVDMHTRLGGPLSKIENTNVPYDRVTTTFQEWVLKLSTDKIFTQSEVNANELNNFVQQHQMAIHRRQDQFIIDALVASGTSNVIVDNGTNLTLAKLREAKKLAVKNNWPTGVTYNIAIYADQLESLLGEERVTSSDYAAVKALVRGEIDTFMGFKFHLFGDMTTGGLPVTGNIRKNFAWYNDAVGFVYSVMPQAKVFPLNDDLYVPTTSYMKAGADVLLPEGVIEIHCDETTPEEA